MKGKSIVKFAISALIIVAVGAFIAARTPIAEWFGLSRRPLWGA